MIPANPTAKPFNQSLNLTQVPSQGVEPAPFFIRFVATFVDGLIIGVATTMINVLVLLLAKLVGMPVLGAVMTYAVQFLCIFLYYGKFYSERGASPGKQLFNLRIEMADTGENPTKMNAFVRETFGKFVSAIILMIGFFMAAFRSDGRALHDLMAGTRVVRIKK